MGDFNYTRLENSDLIAQVTRPNSITTTWSYEPHRNLITQVRNGNISSFGYTNDAIGNRISMSRTGTSFTEPDIITYTYDSRSEVIGATLNHDTTYNYSYSYDPIGNRTVSDQNGSILSYTSNTLNQYTMINAEHPTYDADGNMTLRNGWTQLWNGENRLKTAIKGTQRLEFGYDYMGRRIYKKLYDSESLIYDYHFIYNGYKLVEEVESKNFITNYYIWQPESVGLSIPLSITTPIGTYYSNIDANKNISELTDNTGATVAHYEYSPFGEQTVSIGPQAEINHFRFGSEYFDSETTLIYYNYRYYSPSLGRWISKDPIEERGGQNLYNFIANNPLNKFDLYGLFDPSYDIPGGPGVRDPNPPWMTPPDGHSEERNAATKELLKAILGLSDISTCFTRCMSFIDTNYNKFLRMMWGSWLANNGIPKALFSTPPTHFGGTPSPTFYQPLKIFDESLYRSLSALQRQAAEKAIKAAGRAFLLAQGAYEMGKLICCLSKCQF